MANKNNAIFVILVIVGIALLSGADSLSIASDNSLSVDVTHEVRDLSSGQEPLVITPQGAILQQGESKTFTETQSIFPFCNSLEVLWSIKRGSTVLASDVDSLGAIGASSLFSTFQVTTFEDSQIGTYKLEANWRCNGVLLGIDGDFGGTNSPSVTTFEIVGDGSGNNGGGNGGGNNDPETIMCWFFNPVTDSCDSIFIAAESCAADSRFDTEAQCQSNNQGSGNGGDTGGFNFDSNLLIIGGAVLLVFAFAGTNKKK